MKMKASFRRTIISVATIASIFVVGNRSSSAQVPPQFQQLFGPLGPMIQCGMAGPSWDQLEPIERLCMDRLLIQQGLSVQNLKSKCISADDGRLSEQRSQCSHISRENLQKNISCTVNGANGELFHTRCDEQYARTEPGGQISVLSDNDVVSAFLAGNEIGKTQVETAAGRKDRLAEEQREREKQRLEQQRRERATRLLQMLNTLQTLAASDVPNVSRRALELRKAVAFAQEDSKTGDPQIQQLSTRVSDLLEFEKAERARIAKREASGEKPFSSTGTGPNRKIAQVEGYYEALLKELRNIIGAQADGRTGKEFHRKAETDFDNFKGTYFTSDTKSDCSSDNAGENRAGEKKRARRSDDEMTVTCKVEGTLKLTALKLEAEKMITATMNSGGHDYRFILRAADTEDPYAQFIIEQITAAFIESGYKIIAKSAEEEAVNRGEVDFLLIVSELKYSEPQLNTHNSSVLRALTVRFKLIKADKDPSKRLEIANVPVAVTSIMPRVPGQGIGDEKNMQVQQLGKAAANKISQQVNARLLTLPGPSSSSTYTVHLTGIAQNEREKIRVIRNEITKSLKGTPTQVDPNDTSNLVIKFDKEEAYDPEDIVDALYKLFRDNKSFKFRYAGHNEFVGGF